MPAEWFAVLNREKIMGVRGMFLPPGERGGGRRFCGMVQGLAKLRGRAIIGDFPRDWGRSSIG